jgi:hypothetical protein
VGGSVGVFDGGGEEKDGLAFFGQSLRLVFKRHLGPGGASAENKSEHQNEKQVKSIFHGWK